MRSGAEPRRLFWVSALAILAGDVLTKRLAVASLLPIPPTPVLGDWVQLRLVYNQGAAFGLHLGPWSRWIFMLVAVAAIVMLARLSRASGAGDFVRQLACGCVAGGATGNLIDRVRTAQGVVDFIDVGIGAHRWPTFNVADMGVSCGAVALAVSLWLEDARRARLEARPRPESSA
jgi:signal peptidase II